MKKLSFGLILLLLTTVAVCSITLTSPFVVTQGSTLETDNQSGASGMTVAFNDQTVQLNLSQGSVSGSKINGGSLSPQISIGVDLAGCRWTSSNGLSGVIAAGTCTNLNTTVKGWRNSIETFALTTGVVAGTQVSW